MYLCHQMSVSVPAQAGVLDLFCLDVFVYAVALLGVTVQFSALRLHNFRVGIKRPNQVLEA